MGNAKLTYVGFLTVITQIEGIPNLCSLIPFLFDAGDLNALTLGNFPEPEVINIYDFKLKLWKKTTKLIQIIWKKWPKYCLSFSQQRGK